MNISSVPPVADPLLTYNSHDEFFAAIEVENQAFDENTTDLMITDQTIENDFSEHYQLGSNEYLRAIGPITPKAANTTAYPHDLVDYYYEYDVLNGDFLKFTEPTVPYVLDQWGDPIFSMMPDYTQAAGYNNVVTKVSKAGGDVTVDNFATHAGTETGLIRYYDLTERKIEQRTATLANDAIVEAVDDQYARRFNGKSAINKELIELREQVGSNFIDYKKIGDKVVGVVIDAGQKRVTLQEKVKGQFQSIMELKGQVLALQKIPAGEIDNLGKHAAKIEALENDIKGIEADMAVAQKELTTMPAKSNEQTLFIERFADIGPQHMANTATLAQVDAEITFLERIDGETDMKWFKIIDQNPHQFDQDHPTFGHSHRIIFGQIDPGLDGDPYTEVEK